MGRRTLIIALAASTLAGPAAAAKAPPATDTPQDAVAAIRAVVKRTMKACKTDWASIHAVGYKGAWTITVKIRDSKAGGGKALWSIGSGWPTAKNALAKAVATGCD